MIWEKGGEQLQEQKQVSRKAIAQVKKRSSERSRDSPSRKRRDAQYTGQRLGPAWMWCGEVRLPSDRFHFLSETRSKLICPEGGDAGRVGGLVRKEKV